MAELQPDQVSQADYEALANLRHALRQFTALGTSETHVGELPPQQYQALLAIKGNPTRPQITIGTLAEQLLIAPQTATELANRLVDAGLVERIIDANDRRRHELALTAKGEAALRPLSMVHLHKMRQTAPALIEILRRFNREG